MSEGEEVSLDSESIRFKRFTLFTRVNKSSRAEAEADERALNGGPLLHEAGVFIQINSDKLSSRSY